MSNLYMHPVPILAIMEGNDKTSETGKNKTTVYAIIAACVLGIIIIGAFVLYASTSSQGFSELYFENQKTSENGQRGRRDPIQFYPGIA